MASQVRADLPVLRVDIQTVIVSSMPTRLLLSDTQRGQPGDNLIRSRWLSPHARLAQVLSASL